MVAAAEMLAGPICRMFVSYDIALFDLTLSGFRIFGLCFGFMGFGIFASGFFTALNDGLTSALISFLRTLVFQVAAIIVFPIFWDIDGIWWSIVAAEVMAVITTLFFLVLKRKKYKYM